MSASADQLLQGLNLKPSAHEKAYFTQTEGDVSDDEVKKMSTDGSTESVDIPDAELQDEDSPPVKSPREVEDTQMKQDYEQSIPAYKSIDDSHSSPEKD